MEKEEYGLREVAGALAFPFVYIIIVGLISLLRDLSADWATLLFLNAGVLMLASNITFIITYGMVKGKVRYLTWSFFFALTVFLLVDHYVVHGTLFQAGDILNPRSHELYMWISAILAIISFKYRR